MATLTNSDFVTYLGLNIDKNMTLNYHTEKLLQSINKYIPIFNQIKHYLPLSYKTLMINSFVLPHFHYCLPFLFTCNKKNLTRVETSYKRLLKILFCLPHDFPSDTLFTLSNTPTLEALTKNHLIVLGKNIFKNNLPEPILISIKSNFKSTYTSLRYPLKLPLYHTKHPDKNIFFQAITFYNDSLS